MWQMVGAGLISSGVLLFVLGVLGAMTWGRIMDAFERLRSDHARCEDHTNKCINELYDSRNDQEIRITVLEHKEA